MYKKFIKKYCSLADEYIDKVLIVLVMNVQGITKKSHDYQASSAISEYYSYKQCEEIRSAIVCSGFEVKCYFDELDFISDVSLGVLRDNYPKKIFVLNSAQRGTFVGRKSLIPAFCDMNNIAYIGNDPYAVSFFRNKFHWYAYLNQGGFPVCRSYAYHYRNGWIFDRKPQDNDRLIIKLNNESSSIGLSADSIIIYNKSYDQMIHLKSEQFNQTVILEEFISGYEVETPLIVANNQICCFSPAGISIDNESQLGDRILDYNIRGQHLFSHYEFEKLKPETAEQIVDTTINLVKNTGLRDYARIDYRIDTNDNFYITDIATNPHITKSMTFYYHYNRLGMEYKDLLKTLIGVAIERTKLQDENRD